MPTTKKKTNANLRLKKGKTPRTPKELNIYYTHLTGKNPINLKTKKLSVAYSNWRKDYKKWETSKLKSSPKASKVAQVSAPKPRRRKELAKPKPKKKTTKPRTKVVSKELFKKATMMRYMKAILKAYKINGKTKKPNISDKAITKMNELLEKYTSDLRDNLAKLMEERKKILEKDVKEARKTLPFADFKVVSAVSKKDKSSKMRVRCKGVNQSIVRKLIIGDKTKITQINLNALPILCETVLGFIQGYSKSIEIMNGIYARKKISEKSVNVISQIIEMAM